MVVIGASMGGILAAAMAVALPSVLAGVVLNDIGPDVDPRGMKRISSYMNNFHPHPDWPHAIDYLKALVGLMIHQVGV